MYLVAVSVRRERTDYIREATKKREMKTKTGKYNHKKS